MKKFLSLLLTALLLMPASAAAAESAPSAKIEDYAGRGSVIALIGAGFYTEHPALAEKPDSPLLYREQVNEVISGAWISEKIPAAWDFVHEDADVSHTSFIGTSAATLAGGMFTGAGDILHEDGTVTHESSYSGTAPHAQLLLFKAAPDTSVRLQSEAAAQALTAALALHADVIWLDTDGLTLTAPLRDALLCVQKAGVPVLTGTGDITAEDIGTIPAAYTDRGTLSAHASWPGITLIGAAADPYANTSSFLLTVEGEEDVPVSYSDSCSDYFGAPFAALFGGQTLPLVAVPGVGKAENYAGLNVKDAIVLIDRGEITFAEKAQAASAAGAAAMIVADNGTGLSRMALEEAPIPGVMIDRESGEKLRAAQNAKITFPAPILAPADFSASGISNDLSAAPAFLCAGQRVTAGIPPSQLTSNAYYANVSGTNLAAASAAGYVARAAEYLRACGEDTALALAAAASAAQPLTDADGNLLPLREVGCGLVSASGSYAPLTVSGANRAPISLCGSMEYASASFSLTLTNLSGEKQRVSLSLTATHEAVEADKNGTPVLTGVHLPIQGLRAHAGDTSANICTEKTAVYTIAPGASVTVPLKLVLPDAAAAPLHAIFPYGFFIDGAVTVQCGDTTVTHPYTAFCGDWASAPLADVTVYDSAAPILQACSLSAHLFGGGTDGFTMPLGTKNPYASDSPMGDFGNLVNPSLLGRGWIELELCALRDIDAISLVFYDSDNRKILTRELGGAEKYIRNGTAKLPLWDFAAVDNPAYLFPDGEYRCEIRLSSRFTARQRAEQTLHFSFILDSEKPTVTDLSVRREGKQTLLTVKAADNRALLDISVYDTVFTYAALEGAGTVFAGQKEAEMTFDITQFDALSPLYLEITDRTGSYITFRVSPEEIAAMADDRPDAGDTP